MIAVVVFKTWSAVVVLGKLLRLLVTVILSTMYIMLSLNDCGNL